MKKWILNSLLLIGCVLILCGQGKYALAEEKVQEAEQEIVLLKTIRDTEMKAEASDTSFTIMKLQAETPVILIAPKGDWHLVSYQENQGYVAISDLARYMQANDINAEFSDLEQNMDATFQNVQKMQRQRYQDILLFITIAGLCIAIVGIAIYTFIQKGKEDK